MKKEFLLFTFSIFLGISCNAQLKVHTNGNVGIDVTDPVSKFQVGSTGTSLAKVSIHNASTTTGSRALACYQSITGTNWAYGSVSSVLTGPYGNKLVGAYGSAYRGSSPSGTARTYGVYAIGGNGVNGYNAGIYAKLYGSRDGTAIFAATPNYDETDVDGIYAGYFRGDVYIEFDLDVDGTLHYNSDLSLKKDIRNLEPNTIAKLQKLSAVYYKLKHPTELSTFQESDTVAIESLQFDINSPKYTNDRIGLIAQDIQTVYPELVKEANDGYLKVDYIGLIPVLVEAIKEQQVQIDDLSNEIEGLKQEIGELKASKDNSPTQLK